MRRLLVLAREPGSALTVALPDQRCPFLMPQFPPASRHEPDP